MEPLHLTAKTGDITIIEVILSRGRDINGNTSLTFAGACGRSKAVDYVPHNRPETSKRGWLGRNSLHAALQAGNVADFAFIWFRYIFKR